jgi:hypothetical protein
MPLTINGIRLDDSPRDGRSFFLSYPFLKDQASGLCALPSKLIGPVGLLYVCQREFAATVPHDSAWNTLLSVSILLGLPFIAFLDCMLVFFLIFFIIVYAQMRRVPTLSMVSLIENITLLGADEVTTCHVLVIRHTGEFFFHSNYRIPKAV